MGRLTSRVHEIAGGRFSRVLIFGFSAGLVALVVAVTLFWISSVTLFDSSFEEIARIRNPKYSCDAVLVERNGGATTSFGYSVFLVPSDKKPKTGDPAVAYLYSAFRSANVYGVNLKWRDENTLAIEYLEAKSADQRNAELNVSGQAFKIVMNAGVDDPAALGGMRYDLEKPQ